MSDIVSAYRDPILAIIVLLSVVAVVAVADYSKHMYKKRKRERSIEELKAGLGAWGLVKDIGDFIRNTKNPVETLMSVARMYSKAGNNEQAINLYTAMLDIARDTSEKLVILEELGISYYNAGFLQRAKTIFLEVIRNYHNNPQILSYLMVIYESIGEYKEATDALDCIDELQHVNQNTKHDVHKNKVYLRTMMIISSISMSAKDKQDQLCSIFEENWDIRNVILRHFKSFNKDLFWEKISTLEDPNLYIDILWDFKKSEIPFDLIKGNKKVMDIYRAKGFVDNEEVIEVFQLEVMRLLNKFSRLKGDLEFTYRCHSCKGIMPFYSYRCAICSELGETELVSKVSYVRDVQFLAD